MCVFCVPGWGGTDNVIDREKIRYAVPIYNQDNITNLHDSCIKFTISDSDFLEILLLQIRGETIRYASALNKKTNQIEENLKREIEIMEKQLDSTNPKHLELKIKNWKICVKKNSMAS